jgi:UDP-N-acetylmuramoylalanine--D-glutamate ligase
MYVLGEHRIEDFQNRDFVVKAAGVPLDSIYIAEAKKNSIPVRMSADLFMEISGVETIGVTGTRGKSTVTHMIAAILERAKKKVLLGGNIRGVSTLALLNKVEGDEVAVLELDSWQCQGLGEANLSPHIAVFTTLYPDHENYYKNDPAAYLADKGNIFLYQNPDDTLIAGAQCAPMLIQAFGEHIVSNIRIVDASKLPADWNLLIPGEHNRYDAALALAAGRAYGISDEVSKSALESFKGIPGRLELLREVNDVRYYNDTNATTPEATLAALHALDPEGKQNTILIMGGADKGLDMTRLLAEIPAHTKKLILLAGTGTDRIKDMLSAGTIVYGNLADAVQVAKEAAMPGDTILLSPAFASFGMFKNEYDRGDQFTSLIKNLA